MENRKRNIQIKFRVTEEERTLIEEKMKQVPTSNMEAYLRKMAIDGYIIQIDHSDIKKMTAELQKIGVNINQIARRTNTTGNVYPEDIEEIKGALKSAAFRYCLMFLTFVVFSCIQLRTNSICSLLSFMNFAFTSSAGYSSPAIKILFLLLHTVSRIRSRISSMRSRSRRLAFMRCSYSILSLIISS